MDGDFEEAHEVETAVNGHPAGANLGGGLVGQVQGMAYEGGLSGGASAQHGDVDVLHRVGVAVGGLAGRVSAELAGAWGGQRADGNLRRRTGRASADWGVGPSGAGGGP